MVNFTLWFEFGQNNRFGVRIRQNLDFACAPKPKIVLSFLSVGARILDDMIDKTDLFLCIEDKILHRQENTTVLRAGRQHVAFPGLEPEMIRSSPSYHLNLNKMFICPSSLVMPEAFAARIRQGGKERFRAL
jgi:hypothetical protein